MSQTLKQYLCCLLLAGVVVSLPGCPGCTISSVSGWIVEITTETGHVIKESAGTLAGALQHAWRKVFPLWDGDVEVDPSNPLKGISHGKFIITKGYIENGETKGEIQLILTNPVVERESEDSHDWELSSSNFPAGW